MLQLNLEEELTVELHLVVEVIQLIIQVQLVTAVALAIITSFIKDPSWILHPHKITPLASVHFKTRIQIRSNKQRRCIIKNWKLILKCKSLLFIIKEMSNLKKKRITLIISYSCRILQIIISSVQILPRSKKSQKWKKKII